ncbi:MAG: hypothetical protein V1872_08120 [bacterium]
MLTKEIKKNSGNNFVPVQPNYYKEEYFPPKKIDTSIQDSFSLKNNIIEKRKFPRIINLLSYRDFTKRKLYPNKYIGRNNRHK